MDASPQDRAPHARRSPLGTLRFEALVSGFVGALALAVSTYNVYLQRAQIQAQVWPHLEWTYSEGQGFSWELTNAGVGPALIRGVGVRVDGKPAKTWNDVVDLLSASDKEVAAAFKEHSSWRTTLAGRVLGAGVKLEPMRLPDVRCDAEHPAFRNAFARLEVDICYCSTLGDCWMLRGQKPTRSCPMDRLTFVE